MTVSITRLEGAEAYDLIFPEHLSMLPVINQETMKRSMVNSSQVWVGIDNDKVLAIWGLIPPTLMSDRAYLWLFTTKDFAGHEFILIRHSQRAMQVMLEEFPTIIGHGVVGATQSLRWLRWLGAKFGEPCGEFLPFTIKAKQWQQDSVQRA
jgi:hypothetical protein